MKYLGVDYGQKKIGIAVSDIDGNMAFPREIIQNDSIQNKHIKYIDDLCNREGVKDIVIGKSIDFEGKNNKIEKFTEEFINLLNKDNKYTIHRIDERMTTSLISSENRYHFQKDQNPKNFSKNAKSIRDSSKSDDAKVAALILQNFLDSKSKM